MAQKGQTGSPRGAQIIEESLREAQRPPDRQKQTERRKQETDRRGRQGETEGRGGEREREREREGVEHIVKTPARRTLAT